MNSTFDKTPADTITFSVNRFENGRRVPVGGFADRLKGLIGCYWLAVLLNKRFAIDWTYPDCLSSYYDLSPSAHFAADNEDYSAADPCINLIDGNYSSNPINVENTLKSCRNISDLTDLAKAVAGRRISTNSLMLDILRNDTLLAALNAGGVRISDMTDFIAKAYSRLLCFKESVFAEDDEFRAFQKYVSNSQKPLLGLHFRIGGDSVSWSDPQLDDRSSVEAFCERALSHLAADYDIYLASDSPALKQQLLQVVYEKQLRIFSFKKDVNHMDRSVGHSSSATVMEFECLRRCSRIIHGAGGFSIMAAYSARIPSIHYKQVANVPA